MFGEIVTGSGRAVGFKAAAALILSVGIAGAVCSCSPAGQGPTTRAAAPPSASAPAIGQKWTYLFDGKTLKGWTAPDWGASGKVYVKDGIVHMEAGATCTGITFADKDRLPLEDYELELEGMRVDGEDFFCGLTFPVGKDPITLILGGWGGSVVGLSCLNGMDASENETTQTIEFKQNRWYRIRVRVTKEQIKAWLDDLEIISVDRADKKISVRWEVEPSIPLGIATWKTHGAARNIRIRRLSDADR